MATIRVTFIEPDGTEKAVNAHVGRTLMSAALDNGVRGILAECGGACTCATCHVYIVSRWAEAVGQATPMEQDMLTVALDPQPDSRLSCQVEITENLDGLVVRLPKSQY